MRIIAGEHRGRRILAPEGLSTRPMLDRVREAMFSSLRDWVPGARVLDLFAGSGSLGLEALSRGAQSARLVEQDKHALIALRKNIATLRLEPRAEVRTSDALAPESWHAPERWDMVFLDPPYALVEDARSRHVLLGALERIVREAQAPDGVLMLHAARGALSEAELAFARSPRARDYGTSTLWYLLAPAGAAPR